MYPDAFTVQRLASELNHLLKDVVLKDIFSTSKTDLFFVFNQKKGFKLQFFQGLGLFQFPGIEYFPTKNRQTQFDVLLGQKVVSIKAHPNSRSFEIEFESGNLLVFKLFGKFSNVILFSKEKQAEAVFLQNYLSDLQKPYSLFYSEQEIEHDNLTRSDLKKRYTWLNKDALSYLDNLGYFETRDRKSVYQNFVEQSLTKDVGIIKSGEHLFELSLFHSGETVDTYNSMLEAIDKFSALYMGAESFKLRKQNLLAELDKKINTKIRLLAELKTRLNSIEQKRSYKEIGDLIMANIHSIHTGTSRVELFDFYRNTKVNIKLKPEWNPQQNAKFFYEKSKNEAKEAEFKSKAITSLEYEINRLNENRLKLIEVNDTKSLRKSVAINPVPQNKQTPSLPYKLYKYSGFEILVGKNAKSNDELIKSFGSKNDTWLHAREVSGSHVLIKNAGGKIIPSPVLEKAASLAAFYSKAKSNALVPVIHTLKKFVRKPKGAAPGAVIVERENVIMVEPSEYKNDLIYEK